MEIVPARMGNTDIITFCLSIYVNLPKVIQSCLFWTVLIE